MSTHTLNTPDGPKTRPCNDRCSDDWHAYYAFIDVPYDQVSARMLVTLIANIERLNPAIVILDVVAAPGAAPYPDAPPDLPYVWAIYYHERPDEERPVAETGETTALHVLILESDDEGDDHWRAEAEMATARAEGDDDDAVHSRDALTSLHGFLAARGKEG